uniref:CSON015061 protein n=1 Tax=Culicoides sonorensis TaxID=179676 RepID=A0A336M0P9_CULSO
MSMQSGSCVFVVIRNVFMIYCKILHNMISMELELMFKSKKNSNLEYGYQFCEVPLKTDMT